MNISFRKLFLIFSATALLGSCLNDNDQIARPLTVKVKLLSPADMASATLSGHVVNLKADDISLEATTDDEGIATFTDVIPDVYDISTSWTLSAEEYLLLTGDNSAPDGCAVSGISNRVVVSAETTGLPLPLSTTVAINRSLVIGKLYIAGSRDNNNQVYRAGKFVELFNQSDEAIDVSGLYIGLTESRSPTPGYTITQLQEVFNGDYLAMKQMFRVPDDEPCLVEPGKTLLIAISAQDHTNGNDLERDLTTADLEICGKEGVSTYPDNPDVRNMELIFTLWPALTTINLVPGGPCGVVIFRMDETVDELPLAYQYGKTSGDQYRMLPKKHVIDGVDIVRFTTSTGADLNSKRLYPDIDAGYICPTNTSGLNGEVYYRKTSSRRSASGHILLQDTNNSLNDFQTATTIGIREYDSPQ